MKKVLSALAVLAFFGLTIAHADVVGNKSSKMYFPADCSYVKLIKKDNVVNFKTAAEATAAGYKASSKCQETAAAATFVGNKTSKLYFPSDCSVVKLIKDDNKVTFKSEADAKAAGFKASSKCTDKK